MVINFRARASYDAAQITFRTVVNLDAYRSSDTRVKKAVIGASVDDRFEPWTRGVIMDDLDRQYPAPDPCLLWNAAVAKRKRFVRYTQR